VTIRALFTGDRNWTDRYIVQVTIGGLESMLVTFPSEPLTLIEGEAKGLDRIAREIAEDRPRTIVEPYPADWTRFKNGAGPVRNQQMLDEGEPHQVFAFHNDLLHSRGTLDMIKRSVAAGIDTYHIRAVDEEMVRKILRYQRRNRRG
jgi:hypothetical protein